MNRDHETTPAKGPGRARRALQVVAATLGLGVVFTLAAAGSAVAHLGLPASRRFAAARVNGILEGTFKGKVTIHRVGALHLTRIDGIDAEVLDPEGNRVIFVHSVRARFSTVTLLRSLVGGKRLIVRIPELEVGGAEVVLEENPEGKLGLARAFESKNPSAPSSDGPEISILGIHLEHAWIHGHMAAAPLVDADLKGFDGSFGTTPETTDIDVKRLTVHGRGLPGMNPVGAVEASASLPSDNAKGMRVNARYDGLVGEIPVHVNGSMNGKEVTAVADVPETPPAAFAALAPGQVRLGASVRAHAEVHGTLPVLKPSLDAKVGEGAITMTGTVTLPEEPRTELLANATLNVRDLDASMLQEGAPPSRLTAALDASVISRPGGKVSGTFVLVNQIGEVSGQVVPALTASGELTERSVRGSAVISERGVPATVWFSLDPKGDAAKPSELRVEADTVITDLDAIARIGPIGRGRAHVVAEGWMDLDTKQISGKARIDAFGLDVKGVRLARGVVTATADGTVESPRFAAKVRGAGMSAGGYTFTDIQLGATGTPEAIDVTARLAGDDKAPTASARAHVMLHGSDVTVRRVGVELERDDVKSNIRVAEVRVAGGAVNVRGLVIEGLGDPIEGSARLAPGRVSVKAKAPSVDITRVAKLLAREEDARGHLAFDVDMTASARALQGRVEARIPDLSVREIDGGSVHVVTSAEGKRVRAEVHLALGEVGKLDISAPEVDLRGSMFDASVWKTATGTLAIDGAVDLAKVFEKIPAESRPVGAAAGKVVIHGKASRPSDGAAPGLDLEIATNGLVIEEKQEIRKTADGTLVLGPEPRRTAGLDGSIALKLDASNGRSAIAVKIHDRVGPLVSLDASANLPLAELAKSPDRIVALVSDVPIEAKVAVVRRSLDAVPPALGGPPPVRGDVELTADLKGTARAPKLTLNAKGTGLTARTADCARPVDVEAKVVYDGKKANVHLASSRDGREILGADAAVQVSAAAALAGDPISWEASGDVALTSFPLDTIGSILRQPITGNVNGKISLADLHRAAGLDVSLDLAGLTLDRTRFPSGKVRVTMKNGKLEAIARLDQADGYAETKATGAVKWGSDVAPALDLGSPMEIEIRSKNFRADAVSPFVKGIFTELDGRIDSDARLHMKPGGKDGTMDGAVVIRDGVFEVPQIGERFHGLQGRVVMKPWGTIRLEGFSAEAPTGKITASAEAVMKGLMLQSANARVKIPKGQSIPITVEGAPMGRAYGDVTVGAKMSDDAKRLDVDVGIPVFHVDLPHSIGHAVQPLEVDPTIRVGVHSGSQFVSIPLAPPQEPRKPSDLHIHAAIKLGDDVAVKRDTTVHVAATGQTIIDISDKTRVTGQIRLVRGDLELQGKKFFIDRGVVSFVGPDPGNPLIIATAYWDAPDGTRVYADFSGHVTSGKLVLRSEPAFTQDEILALILFGSSEGSLGAQSPPGQAASTGLKAASMAGGVVTEGLNKAISGVTAVDISTRIDTSSSDNPRPELAVQISKSVAARLGYKLGVPAPGENTDRTELTLDWRFHKRWSLVAVVGDQGSTSLDVVWRMRY